MKNITKIKLIEKYQNMKKEIINPDDLTWMDLELESISNNYNSIEQYLESELDFDEGQQTKLRMIDEFLTDLHNIKEED